MNQLMVEKSTSAMRRLRSSDILACTVLVPIGVLQRAHIYSVVKFIVKVRLMEKSVNKAVGSVIVVKVTTQ
jgi:hypothetical protein